jgi:hypothetical protein
MQKTIILCDVCEQGAMNCEGGKRNQEIQVIFTTEQEEGRTSPAYLSMTKLDLCCDCFMKVLNGNYIYAQGAMGHNSYEFKTA